MRVLLTQLKTELGSALTGKVWRGMVEMHTAELMRAAVVAGKTVHVGSRSIGDCIQLRREGRMIAQTNSRRHGMCERAIYTLKSLE